MAEDKEHTTRNGFAKEWQTFKRSAERYGIYIIALGVLALVVDFVTKILSQPIDFSNLWLGLFAVGLGLVAIGMSEKADQKYTELLSKIDKNVTLLPTLFKNDILTLPGQQQANLMVSDQNKEEAQKRLDEDTKKIGHVRGELYPLENGSWVIHWGGKYQL